jgi:hypothetical protein
MNHEIFSYKLQKLLLSVHVLQINLSSTTIGKK